MISNATPGDWTDNDDARLSPHDDAAEVDASQTATGETSVVELTSAEAWCQLIREVVGLAKNGGGRIEIRCTSADNSATSLARIFAAPITVVVPTPTDSARGEKTTGPPNLQPVRIVTDPDAPALQPQDVDHLYPWRQKDLLRELNSRLGRRFLNSYDIQAVRRQHHLDDRPDFVFNLPGTGRRYSPAVAEWFMAQHTRDPEFFHRARMADHEILKLRRRKPK